ncbi:MAG: hypothetical protein H0V73_05735 [Chloroflexi bacterium]|nr:hypothetical protein [Chloroflexota bacterium]
MKTHTPVTPRTVTLDHDQIRPEGRARQSRLGAATAAAAAAGFTLALAIGACNVPAGSTIPGTSIVVPSIAASAVASLGTQAALAALDVVDAQIAANTSATGLTADDAASLTQLTAGLRTSLQSGDMTAARTAADNLVTKAQSLASKLSGDAGTQLTAAIAALKAALAAS